MPTSGQWVAALKKVSERILKIETPKGRGTGFIIAPPDKEGVVGIATAYHVVDEARKWLQPIRVTNVDKNESVLLMPRDTSFHYNETKDLALIRTAKKLPVAEASLSTIGETNRLLAGAEVGWCGYPAVAPSDTLCFFSGRISAWWQSELAYLVDGVAINGVSGGPVFTCEDGVAQLVGVVTEYIANRATGETLPGVSLVRAINPYFEVLKTFEGKPTSGGSAETKIDPKPQQPT